MIKFIAHFLLVIAVLLPSLPAYPALSDLDRQEIGPKNWLAPFNGGFESGKAIWVASGGTFTAVTSGSNLLVGKGSATWDSSAASQTLTSKTVTIEKGYYGQNCEASITMQTPSGTATHLLQAYDGTNILVSQTVVSSTTPRQMSAVFPCPTSGTAALRLISVAADEPLIAVDEGYLGLARNVGSTSLDIGWTTYTPTLGGSATASTNTAKWMRVGDSIILNVYLAISNTPAGTMTVSVPSGITLDTANIPGTGDNTSSHGTGGWYDATGPTTTTIRAYATTSTTITLTSANVQLGTNLASGDYIQFTTYPLKVVGWASQNIVMPDAQGWFAAGLISGAAVSLSTSSQASAVEMTNGSLVMSLAAGSAAAGIPCASGTTNTAGALTCASANESVGFTVDVPRSGAYRVCMSASNTLYDSGGATNVNASQTFQLNRTTAASSTVVTSGVATAFTQLTTNSGGGAEIIGNGYPFTVCPIHQLSAGSNTFRLMYASSISGTLSSNDLTIGGGVGSQGAYFSIMPVNSTANAILANSVSTSNTNGDRIERAYVAVNCSSTPCTIASGSSGISSITRSSTGVYVANFAAGTFSAIPACTINPVVSGGAATALFKSPSTSSITINAFDSTPAAADIGFNLVCIGPR